MLNAYRNVTHILNAVWIATVLLSNVGVAQESPQNDGSKSQKPEPEMVVAQLRIVSPEGEPVEGATVYPSGLRSDMDPGSHYGWRVGEYGSIPRVKTDENGLAEVSYPKFILEKLKTSQVTWSADHSGFVIFREDRPTGEDPTEIELKHGFRIALTAVDGRTGERIKDEFFPVMAGNGWEPGWTVKKGIAVSRVFGLRQKMLRVVHLPQNGPAMFSDLIDVPVGEEQGRVFMKGVKLLPGVRVAGKLSEDVPRPIVNGTVNAIALDVSKEQGANHPLRWVWWATTKIEEDGSFVFEALPPNCNLQMIPICEGWIGAKPSEELAKAMFAKKGVIYGNQITQPQLVRIEQQDLNPILEMVPSSRLEVLVTDPDGNPLSDCVIAMWPNQAWFAVGTQILGEGMSSLEQLRKPMSLYETGWEPTKRFQAKTNDEGKAIIANLPSDAQFDIAAEHKQFELPVLNRERQLRVQVDPGENKVTLKLQPKGLDAIGESEHEDDR